MWAGTAYRIHGWRVPPHWSSRDWREEIDAESIAAACQAIKAFDPARGLCLSRFARHQMLAKAMARYRKEWNFALRLAAARSGGGRHRQTAGSRSTKTRLCAPRSEHARPLPG